MAEGHLLSHDLLSGFFSFLFFSKLNNFTLMDPQAYGSFLCLPIF